MSNPDDRRVFPFAKRIGLDGERETESRPSIEEDVRQAELKARGEPVRRDDQEPAAKLKSFSPEAAVELPSLLPQRRRATSWGGIVSFCLCVLLPTIAAAIYYLGFASNQYVVQWQFTVRSADTATLTSPATSTLTALLGTTSAANATDSYVVVEYLKSQQAVIDLEKRIGLRALYSRPSIDLLSKVATSTSVEKFVTYWNYMISASFDQITGISMAEVRAFTPEDAYLIATTLVALSEVLVNDNTDRPLKEAVRYAETEVERSQDRLRKIRADLAEYRNTATVIDPNSSVVLSNATVASTLRQTIAQYQADLGTALRGGLGQTASQVEILKRRIKATQEQLKDVESEIGKAKEGNQPLSVVVGRYEELDLERQFAQALLTSTMQSLEQARANAAAKRLFIIPYVKPAIPQSSTYPNRPLAIITVAGACLLFWTIGLLLARSIREHLA